MRGDEVVRWLECRDYPADDILLHTQLALSEFRQLGSASAVVFVDVGSVFGE